MAAGLYYSEALYLKRWGAEELDRLTMGEDDVRDPEAFNAANADASADMDAYLGGRYKLPFAEPIPRLLVSIAAVLVREKLHGTYATEAVTREADQARRTLRDLSNGTATLTVDDTGEQPEQGGGIGSAWAAPGRVFDAETLAKF